MTRYVVVVVAAWATVHGMIKYLAEISLTMTKDLDITLKIIMFPEADLMIAPEWLNVALRREATYEEEEY